MSNLEFLLIQQALINDTVIRPDHLQDLRHKQLYSKMVELHSAGKYFNLIALSMLPDLEIYGGISYLNELNAFCDLEKFDEVEELILDAWKEQQTQMILTKATFEKWESARVIDELEKIENLKLKNGTTISEGLAAIYEAPWEEKEDTTGITTGIQALDDITGGFQEGEVTILAARPSMGKTDVMLHFAKETGWAGYLPILFSLEMPEKLIISRLVASTGNINRVKMRNPYKFLKPKQKEKWTTIIANLDETNMIIFDESGQTIPEMRAQIRKLMYEYPDRKPVVFIDYLTHIPHVNFSIL